jgi:hypothetical protein
VYDADQFLDEHYLKVSGVRRIKQEKKVVPVPSERSVLAKVKTKKNLVKKKQVENPNKTPSPIRVDDGYQSTIKKRRLAAK